MMSWTADPPDCRARTNSFFSFMSLSCSAVTLLHSATALSMFASAMAIFSSYSALYWANLVHLRLGLIANHKVHQSQVLPMRKLRMVRCKQYKANFWSCIFLNVIRDALPLAWACRRARTLPILSSRTSSMKPKIPALKKTLVCPRRNFSLSSLMTSITAPAALLSFLALATAPAAIILYLALKSGYNILLGNPSLQIAIPANTPLHWYWCMISSGCTPPGCLCVFGTTQRMKDGSVEYNTFIKSSNWDLKNDVTVLPPPFFLPPPPASFLASSGCPGWSKKHSTRSLLEPFFMSSTTVSLRGSLFFSNHPVRL